MLFELILSIIVLLLSIPTGLWLQKLTRDEKPIYKKYFPIILWILAILTAIFYTIEIKTALTLNFMFLTILIWLKADELKSSKFKKWITKY